MADNTKTRCAAPAVQYLPDFEPLEVVWTPSDVSFMYTREWLHQLILQYDERAEHVLQGSVASGEDLHMQMTSLKAMRSLLGDVWDVSERCQQSVMQYRVLCQRTAALEQKLVRIKSGRRYRAYFSVWNQYQTYRDVCTLCGVVMGRQYNMLMSNLDAVENLNQQYLDAYGQDEEEEEDEDEDVYYIPDQDQQDMMNDDDQDGMRPSPSHHPSSQESIATTTALGDPRSLIQNVFAHSDSAGEQSRTH